MNQQQLTFYNTQILLSGKRFKNLLIFAYVLLITIIVFIYNTKDIDLKIAYGGWGPQDYVNQKIFPENFKNNWDSGILAYDNSIAMKVYYWLAKYFGTNTSTIIYPYMFFQILIFCITVYALTYTLFKNIYISILATALFSIHSMAGINLSRFGSGFGSYLSLPLFYGYANSLRLLAIMFFLRNKLFLFSFCIIASFYIHFTMSAFALIFVLSYSIFKKSYFNNKEFLFCIVIIILSILPYTFFILSKSSIPFEAVPNDDWIKSTKIFCLHWYPITMKLFSSYAHLEFFPILLICIGFFLSLSAIDINNKKHKIILNGCFICLILTIIGVIFSELFTIPFFVKISFQRSSALLTFFGILYVLNFLLENLQAHLISLIASGFFLSTLFLCSPGLSILAFLILFYFEINKQKIGPIVFKNDRKKLFLIFFILICLGILLITFSVEFKNNFLIFKRIHAGLWAPLRKFSFSNSYSFLTFGGNYKFKGFSVIVFFTLILLLFFKIERLKISNKIKELKPIVLFMVLMTSFVLVIKNNEFQAWESKQYNISKSYYDVQIWAKQSTPINSLFQMDPSHYYGWRDFSQRSSIGNLREWGFTSIAYIPDNKRFVQGKKLMKEFGIDIDTIKLEDVEEIGSIKFMRNLDSIVQNNYYEMDNNSRNKFLIKYGVDFFIMQKKILSMNKRNEILNDFILAYENNDYVVFQNRKKLFSYYVNICNMKAWS